MRCILCQALGALDTKFGIAQRQTVVLNFNSAADLTGEGQAKNLQSPLPGWELIKLSDLLLFHLCY